MQVVAMVTDGHQRPEIPQEDLCPSSSFPGMGEYVKLMNSCWKQVSSPSPCLQLGPLSSGLYAFGFDRALGVSLCYLSMQSANAHDVHPLDSTAIFPVLA